MTLYTTREPRARKAGAITGTGTPPCINPALCLQFASVGELLGGSLLAEKVFAYPGLGQATIDAGLRGDIPLLMGIVLFSTVLVFCGNSFAAMLLARTNHILEPK